MAEPQTGTPQDKTGEKSPDELSKEELDKATGGGAKESIQTVLEQFKENGPEKLTNLDTFVNI